MSRRWLSECLDLNVDEYTDFILDGSGWGCHHGNLHQSLAQRERLHPRIIRPDQLEY